MPAILQGDALTILRTLPAQSVHTCVTSPPYWGLRDYGVAGQMGLEETPEKYVAGMVAVFSEVKRVLRDDGTLWVNIGDSYFGSWGNYSGENRGKGYQRKIINGSAVPNPAFNGREKCRPAASYKIKGLKPKDLVGIPWMLAFALRADGWFLRQEIIWHKPSCMPESVQDRCTKSHEQIFLLSKNATYFFDNEAIKEPSEYPNDDRKGRSYDHHKSAPTEKRNGIRPGNYLDSGRTSYALRNKRSVWSVTNCGYKEAHFAAYPPDLIKPCILAGSPAGGVVLDPFAGSGTTGQVALELGREAVLIELNPDYVKLIEQRCNVTKGLAL